MTYLDHCGVIRNEDYDLCDLQFSDQHHANIHPETGLLLTSNLSWSEHINTIAADASKALDVLSRLRYTIDRKSLEAVYFSFIRPKLEYASHIWDDCSEKDSTHLENLQLCAARVVTGAKRGTSHELLYRDTNWETLARRREVSKLKFFHKLVHRDAPDYLTDLVPSRVCENVSYSLRNRSDLRQLSCRTEKYLCCLSVLAGL